MFVRRRPTHHQRLVQTGRSEGRATGWPPGNRIAEGECGTVLRDSKIWRFERAERAGPYKISEGDLSRPGNRIAVGELTTSSFSSPIVRAGY